MVNDLPSSGFFFVASMVLSDVFAKEENTKYHNIIIMYLLIIKINTYVTIVIPHKSGLT